MSIYPKHLYKSPGPHRRLSRTFDYIGCADAEQEKALLAEGWNRTFEEAWGIETEANTLVEKAEELREAIDEISPPTRDELERKAVELGVPFNARTKDEMLLKRIAEAAD